MKIDLKKLGAQALKVAAPIAAAVVVQKLTTGKVDVAGAIRKAILDRLAG
ncbi:hypothetical protein [Sphingomonas panni]|nr:hypothetical protein [Sphingomonas panni]